MQKHCSVTIAHVLQYYLFYESFYVLAVEVPLQDYSRGQDPEIWILVLSLL